MMLSELAQAKERVKELEAQQRREQQERVIDTMSQRRSGVAGPNIGMGLCDQLSWWEETCQLACDRIWELEQAQARQEED